MSPVATCNRCGRPRPCPRHSRTDNVERRAYSGTARYVEVRDEVLERDGAVCAYCQGPIDLELAHGDDRLELAHVIAHADGGPFEADNLRPAHRYCNRAAGKRPILEEA